MWIYIKTEPQLWTVGFYTPSGKFETDSDFDIKEEAAKRCAWLNGSDSQQARQQAYDDSYYPDVWERDPSALLDGRGY